MMNPLPATIREQIVEYIGCNYVTVAAKFDIDRNDIISRLSGNHTPLECAKKLVDMLCATSSAWTVQDLCSAFDKSELNRYSHLTRNLMKGYQPATTPVLHATTIPQ